MSTALQTMAWAIPWLHDGEDAEDAEDAKVLSYSVNFGILSLQASNALIRFRVGKVGSWLAK